MQCAALLSTNIVRVRELLPGPLILLHVRGFKVMSSGFMDFWLQGVGFFGLEFLGACL